MLFCQHEQLINCEFYNLELLTEFTIYCLSGDFCEIKSLVRKFAQLALIALEFKQLKVQFELQRV